MLEEKHSGKTHKQDSDEKQPDVKGFFDKTHQEKAYAGKSCGVSGRKGM